MRYYHRHLYVFMKFPINVSLRGEFAIIKNFPSEFRWMLNYLALSIRISASIQKQTNHLDVGAFN